MWNPIPMGPGFFGHDPSHLIIALAPRGAGVSAVIGFSSIPFPSSI